MSEPEDDSLPVLAGAALPVYYFLYLNIFFNFSSETIRTSTDINAVPLMRSAMLSAISVSVRLLPDVSKIIPPGIDWICLAASRIAQSTEFFEVTPFNSQCLPFHRKSGVLLPEVFSSFNI